MAKEDIKKSNSGKKTDAEKLALFKKLVNLRVNKAVNYIDLIGALGRYEPNDQQRTLILKHVDDAVARMKTRIVQKAPKRETFHID